MARMTHFHGILKRDLFKRITFLRTFLSGKDILAAAAVEDYHWRDRLWTPMRTLWTFLVQVLNPDWSCRAAVAQVLAEQAAIGAYRCVGRRGWQARMRVNGKHTFLRYFYDEVEAAKAYDRAARKYHGEFAALNFPNASLRLGSSKKKTLKNLLSAIRHRASSIS